MECYRRLTVDWYGLLANASVLYLTFGLVTPDYHSTHNMHTINYETDAGAKILINNGTTRRCYNLIPAVNRIRQ